MTKLDDTPWMHLISQFYEHGEAYITGTEAGLLALRDAIEEAILNGDGKAAVFSTDGEGYRVVVRKSNTVAGCGEPVYFETLARNAFHTELKLHESISRDRRRRNLRQDQPA
jgi:pyruvate/2-oxoacid:ferredoxin oxidoreductase beta subunit